MIRVAIDQHVLVKAEAEHPVVFHKARREPRRQAVIERTGPLPRRQPRAQSRPVRLGLACHGFHRDCRHQRKLRPFPTLQRGVEKNQPRQMPRTRRDLGRGKVERERTRGTGE